MLTNKKASALLILVLLLFSASSKLYQNASGYVGAPYVKKEIALDTLVEIQAYGAPKAKVEQAVKDAFQAIEQIDKLANAYDADSEVSQLSLSADLKPVQASVELFEMLSLSRRYFEETNGAFDPTVRPVVLLWDFDAEKLPGQASLDKALKLVGSEALTLDAEQNTVRLERKGMALDLGGVAKGFAADRAAEVLLRSGVTSAIVTTGSTTRILGGKPHPDGWFTQLQRVFGGKRKIATQDFTIGVQDPRADTGRVLALLKISDKNISTSGDYQQYFVRDGQRYSHIINPRTGYSDSDLASVTVVTTRSDAEADILSTALFVMGSEAAKKWLLESEDVWALLITVEGQASASKALGPILQEAPKRLEFF